LDVLLIVCTELQLTNIFTVLQNILAGSLFGIMYGFPLTCLLTAMGATNCYLLSAFFGRAHVMRYFGKQLDVLTARVNWFTWWTCCGFVVIVVIVIM